MYPPSLKLRKGKQAESKTITRSYKKQFDAKISRKMAHSASKSRAHPNTTLPQSQTIGFAKSEFLINLINLKL
jgi:hypothetical protein